MSNLPGDFSATALRNVKVRLSEIFGTESMNRHLNRDTPIFNGLFGSQQIRLDGDVRMALMNGKHCEAVEVFFLQSCDLTVDDCDTSCTIPEGSEPCVQTGIFLPSICVEKSIKIREDECKNEIEYEERLALQTATLLAALDQDMEARTVAELVNQAESLTDIELPTGGLNAGGTIWEIPPAEWNAQLIVDLQCLLDDCEFVDPKMVTGKIWKKQIMLANAAQGSGCCDTQYNSLLGTIPTIQNSRELDKLVGAPTVFLVDNAKIGYFNRYIHMTRVPTNQLDAMNTHHYFMESPRLRHNISGSSTAVIYDFYWQRVCISEDVYEVRIKAKHRGGFVCLPDGCEGEPNKKVIQIEQKNCAGC